MRVNVSGQDRKVSKVVGIWISCRLSLPSACPACGVVSCGCHPDPDHMLRLNAVFDVRDVYDLRLEASPLGLEKTWL